MLIKKLVNRPITVLMTFILILIIGFYTFSRLSIDLLPEFKPAFINVFLDWEGASPQEVENKITKVLESSLTSLNNLKKISSTSSKGTSNISLEFNQSVDLSEVTNDVRDALDLAKLALPKDIGIPRIFKFSLSSLPILELVLYGDKNLSELKDFAEKSLVKKIEQVDGVSLVSLIGGSEKYILIELSQNRLNAYGITIAEVSNALTSQNYDLSVGEIIQDSISYLIETKGKFKDISDIEELIVTYKNANISSNDSLDLRAVKIKDLAEVKEVYKDLKSFSEYNGKPSISISIRKKSGTNSVQISDKVLALVNDLKHNFPSGIYLDVTKDNTEFIRASLKTVSSSAFSGAILAIIIILFFLRNIRASIIISIVIPVAIVITFMLMYFFKITLNILSLAGLALGLGMLVDSSIVIIENIYKYRIRGTKLKSSVFLGTQEMLTPVIASILTSICVFAPMIFFKEELGPIGIIMKDLAFTVVISLSASLIVSIFLVPVLASHFIGINTHIQKPIQNKFLKFVNDLIEKFLIGLEFSYIKFLYFILNHKKFSLFILFLIFIVSLFIFPMLKFASMPNFRGNNIDLQLTLPIGSTIERTREVVNDIFSKIQKDIKNYKALETKIGHSRQGFLSNQANYAEISIIFDLDEAEKNTNIISDAQDQIRKYFSLFPDVDFILNDSSQQYLSSEPLSLSIRGEEFEDLEKYGSLLIQVVKKEMPQLIEPQISIGETIPQINIEIDREKAMSLGFKAFDVFNEIKSNLEGKKVGQYTIDGKNYDILVKVKESDMKDLNDLGNIYLPNKDGKQILLSSFVKFKETVSPVSIYRSDMKKTVYFTAKVPREMRIDEANRELRELVKSKIPYQEGISLSYEGEYDDFKKYMGQFLIITLVAIFLVFGVMASQFESLFNPFIILFTIPLTIIGVAFIYLVSGETLSTFTAVGFLMLVGIVVNNGIVLIDYTNLLIKRGFALREAILEAGRSRLRPVLMTTFTTIFGLIPMSFSKGLGSELVRPISMTVLGGLTVGAFLTLLFIPLFFEVFNRTSSLKKSFFIFRIFKTQKKTFNREGSFINEEKKSQSQDKIIPDSEED